MQQGDELWHKIRDQCAITWSKLGDALGVGYNSRISYMKEKLQMKEKQPANWRMEEGTRREPWGAELYYRLMAALGHPVRFFMDPFTYLPEDRRMGGSVDRIVESELTGERWVLEIKTCPDGFMRTQIPVSHLLQMLGSCMSLRLPYAHYICWSQHQGLLLAEIRFHPDLWEKHIYPRAREFANLWAVCQLPERMRNEDKQFLLGKIEELTTVLEIPEFTRERLTGALLQRRVDTPYFHRIEQPCEPGNPWEHCDRDGSLRESSPDGQELDRQ